MARVIGEKKGMDIVLLDVSELLWITDVFIIASGTSRPHVQSLAEDVELKLKSADRRPLRVEGKQEGKWVLLDYGEVVIHIFQPETRDFYGLERLWGDAPRLTWETLASEA
ncbi:MAG: ribosome silencing factor [Acidimicrobiia bacterium]|nr:ribosome silencing factor [Acidimicrobiia bacterium]MDH3398484.1 ribosome silencing factor [Acidimicrobiia bacterium]